MDLERKGNAGVYGGSFQALLVFVSKTVLDASIHQSALKVHHEF